MFKKDDFAVLDGYKFYLVEESVDEELSKSDISPLYSTPVEEMSKMTTTYSQQETTSFLSQCEMKKILFGDVFHRVNTDDKPISITPELYTNILNGPLRTGDTNNLELYFGTIYSDQDYIKIGQCCNSVVAFLDYEELFYADDSNLIILDEKEARHHPHILWVNFNNDKKEKLLLVHEKNNMIDSVKVVDNF